MPPRQTLTQRRSTSDKKPKKPPKPNPLDRVGLSSIDKMSDPGSGPAMKIFIWVAIILATGIGLAFLIRGLTSQSNDEPKEEVEEPAIVEEEPVELDETPELDETDEAIDEVEEVVEDDSTDEVEVTAGLTNDYSQLDQSVSEALSSNVVNTIGYSYATYGPNFDYTVKLSSATTFPTATATLDTDAKTLTVVVENLRSDGIVGNGGSGTTDFSAAKNVTSVDIANAGGKTTFVFKLSKVTDYKIYADKDNQYFKVDIKNS